MKPYHFVVAVAAMTVTTSAAHAQESPRDYPQWRGRNGDGSSSAFTPPATWPDALTRRWQIEVGEGYATPLVIGDTVYVFARRNDDEVIVAVEAATGRERWRSAYPAPYTPSSPTVRHGSGPKATPLFHDGKLFTVGISGIVSAFEATSGARLWQTSPPAETPFYSAASSPVGAKGIVIVHPGNYEPLTAFDADTGAIRWRAGAGGFFMSPLIVTLGGIVQVVSVTQEGVIVAKASRTAFEPLKRYAVAKSSTWAQPAISGNRIFIKDARSLTLWTIEGTKN